MDSLGKIQDLKLIELFNGVIDAKTIVSMHIMGTEFERLTCILGIEQGFEGKFLLVDKPDGFDKAVKKSGPWQLGFNFNGPDRVECVFTTIGGVSNGTNLKIPFPEFAERLQRRRDFRVRTLPGSKMVFVLEKIKGVIGLINISLGGAYGVLMKHNQKGVKGSLFSKDQTLYKIGIIFPADNDQDEQVIIINQAEVRRIEHDPERHLYKYAFEFTDMDRSQKQKLTRNIYHIQRQYLKNR